MKKGLIIGSGEIRNLNKLKHEHINHDFIICADGGVKHCVAMGLSIDLVIGDLDSISESQLSYVSKKGIPVQKYPTEKDETDLEIALTYLVENNFEMITMMGVTGHRLDHSLANIFLLKKLNNKQVFGRIIDDNNIIYYLEGKLQIPKQSKYLSVIPLSDRGVIVSLEGVYYPLNKKHISFGSTLGISNEINEEYAQIEIHSGGALIIESED